MNDAASDKVFNSCWHYSWITTNEPDIRHLYIYSAVDRTIKREAIEAWIQARQDRLKMSKRNLCSTLVFDKTNHVEHFWRERQAYVTAIYNFIQQQCLDENES